MPPHNHRFSDLDGLRFSQPQANDVVKHDGQKWINSPGVAGPTGPTGPAGPTGATGPAGADATTPPGGIVMYGGSSAPTGWLLCDGSSQLRATYAALFAIIGTTFGAVDGTHFNVPDLRDRFPIGKGIDIANDALGETGGARNVTLTSAQSGIVAHNHGVGTLVTSDPGGHTHTVNQASASGGVADMIPPSNNTLSLTRNTGSSGAHTHTISGSVANNTAADAGSSHTNMPPFIALNFIIKT